RRDAGADAHVHARDPRAADRQLGGIEQAEVRDDDPIRRAAVDRIPVVVRGIGERRRLAAFDADDLHPAAGLLELELPRGERPRALDVDIDDLERPRGGGRERVLAACGHREQRRGERRDDACDRDRREKPPQGAADPPPERAEISSERRSGSSAHCAPPRGSSATMRAATSSIRVSVIGAPAARIRASANASRMSTRPERSMSSGSYVVKKSTGRTTSRAASTNAAAAAYAAQRAGLYRSS